MKKLVSPALILVGVILLFSKGIDLQPGDSAPDFALTDESGVEHRLSDYLGKPVVVYFYPKDDTPGCTKEACAFRDDNPLFEELGVRVFGISYDSPKSHRRFKSKYDIPFTLLSDSDKTVAKSYGAAGLIFPKRVTFIIDEEGKISKVYEKVSVTTHSREILDFLGTRTELLD
ncbi:MAG: peroxiredoxin [Candidatus Marinimicrobia bacterium]|jgi:peroxiredoxin Q/BCP|nr:peroxiredoxin [Candidatus Neomarinimicrobiota bacterium]